MYAYIIYIHHYIISLVFQLVGKEVDLFYRKFISNSAFICNNIDKKFRPRHGAIQPLSIATRRVASRHHARNLLLLLIFLLFNVRIF